MKRQRLVSFITGVMGLVIAGLVLSGCQLPTGLKKTEGLKVAATIFPVYDLARTIGGDKAEVVLVVQPGVSPHTFEVTPQKIKKLQGARLVFAIGHGLDDWVSQLAKNAGVDQVVTVDKGIELKDFNSVEEEHHHEGVDPHYWLTVTNLKQMAETIYEKLVSLDKANQAVYQQNLESLIRELDQVDKEIRPQLAGKTIATFHSAWAYFAEEYQMEVAAVFEPFAGKEPTPEELKQFQEAVQRDGVRVIFSEPQLSTVELGPIAADLGVGISILDPVGGVEGRQSVSELLRFNTKQILVAEEAGLSQP